MVEKTSQASFLNLSTFLVYPRLNTQYPSKGDFLLPNVTKPIKIAVIGSGYVGLVAAVCFAEIGHDVICVDNDEHKVTALQSGETIIHEQYLPELLDRYRNRKIRFTTDLAEATRMCEAIFIAVGTPQSEAGDADLS
jgi:UDPglucose 6-dehydrogenase